MKPAALLLCSLIALLVRYEAAAASQVLYQTGWEASSGNPAWVTGNVWPQNSWDKALDDDPGSHRVVVNGSPEASPFGTAIITPYGNQFHRFTANSSSQAIVGAWAWPNLTDAFISRPAGFDVLTESIDIYVPSGDSADGSAYGLYGYDYDASVNDYFLDYGFLVIPNSRTIRLIIDATETASVAATFSYDTWFNIAIVVDYTSGAVRIFLNGVVVPGLAGANPYLVDSILADVDLFCRNSRTAANPRMIFSDNYRVVAGTSASVSVHPKLAIEAGAIGEWHISWSVDYLDWILESTQDITAAGWTNEGVTPEISGGVASVDLPNAPPRTFFRLRKP